MPLPYRGKRYIVSDRETFQNDWQRGVMEGWINPMTDPTVLGTIREHLAGSPGAAPQIPGLPDNVRVIRFPRSAVHENGRLEIRYEIVEDDGRVWLTAIRPVG